MRAHDRCAQAGGQFTAMRARVLDALIEAGGPIRPYEMMDAFARAGRPAKPPSVYRALEFWAGLGIVHRLESLKAFALCTGDHAQGEPAVFLLCDACGRAEERASPVAVAEMRALAQACGFRLRAVALEAQGLCATCAAEQSERCAPA
jgi:Fur family zinc uptake transcriptional regulator